MFRAVSFVFPDGYILEKKFDENVFSLCRFCEMKMADL